MSWPEPEPEPWPAFDWPPDEAGALLTELTPRDLVGLALRTGVRLAPCLVPEDVQEAWLRERDRWREQKRLHRATGGERA